MRSRRGVVLADGLAQRPSLPFAFPSGGSLAFDALRDGRLPFLGVADTLAFFEILFVRARFDTLLLLILVAPFAGPCPIAETA